MTRVVQVHENMGSFHDTDEWLAGGELRNETLAGGFLFGSDFAPAIENKIPKKLSNVALMNSGKTFALLNKGFSSVWNLATNTILDLITDYEISKNIIIRYEIKVTKDGASYTYQSGSIYHNDNNGVGMDSFAHTVDTKTSLDELSSVFGSKSIDMLGLQSQIGRIGIAVDIASSVVSGTINSENIGDIAKASTIASANSLMSSAITKAVTSAFSIHSIAVGLVVGTIIGSVVSEIAQVATGYDTHFGPGGEFMGTINGVAHFHEPQSVIGYVRDVVMSAVTFGGYVTQAEMEKADFDVEMSNAIDSAMNHLSAEDMMANMSPAMHMPDTTLSIAQSLAEHGNPSDIGSVSLGTAEMEANSTGVTSMGDVMGDSGFGGDGADSGGTDGGGSNDGDGNDSGNAGDGDGAGMGDGADNDGEGNG